MRAKVMKLTYTDSRDGRVIIGFTDERGKHEIALSTVETADELSPNFGDGRSRSGGGGCGLTVGRLGDDLDPVVECHTENEFWQLVGAIETAPAFLRGF